MSGKMGLGRRLVACPGWRWLPGMRYRCASWDPRWPWMRVSEHPEHAAALAAEPGEEAPFPDLDDPATLGCLLALVREAWGDATIYVAKDGAGWAVFGGRRDLGPLSMQTFGSEAEALVAALEAAP